MNLDDNSALEIIVLCNKNDYFLTQICIASIRYYYPTIKIHIVKDELNGIFSTKELESKFNVNNLDLRLKKYGYCTGKISVLLAEELKGKRILLLDSDIIFIGKVLDRILPYINDYDFIVTPQFPDSWDNKWFRDIYYDMDWAVKSFPGFQFPGYTFNGGSMVITPGKIEASEMIEYVDLSNYPYWTELTKKHLPCRDQSLLNILLPLKERRSEVSVKPVFFQVWSETKRSGKHDMLLLDIPILEREGFKDIIDNYDLSVVKMDGYPFLVHWAGAIRIPYLKKMSHHHLLYFFQSHFYSRLFLGRVRFLFNKNYQMLLYYFFTGKKKINKAKIYNKVLKWMK